MPSVTVARAEDQQMRGGRTAGVLAKGAAIAVLLVGALLAASLCFGVSPDPSQVPNIFKPASTAGNSIFHMSILILAITGLIFAIGFGLVAYAVTKYRRRDGEDDREPRKFTEATM